jgi:hypothetical protein
MSSQCGESIKWATAEALLGCIIKRTPEVGNGLLGLSFSVVPFGPSHVRIGAIGVWFIGSPHVFFSSHLGFFYFLNLIWPKYFWTDPRWIFFS